MSKRRRKGRAPADRAALVAIRERAGLGVSELAREIGVSRMSVYYWEIGTYRPERENLRALCEACGTTLAGYERLVARLEREAA